MPIEPRQRWKKHRIILSSRGIHCRPWPSTFGLHACSITKEKSSPLLASPDQKSDERHPHAKLMLLAPDTCSPAAAAPPWRRQGNPSRRATSVWEHVGRVIYLESEALSTPRRERVFHSPHYTVAYVKIFSCRQADDVEGSISGLTSKVVFGVLLTSLSLSALNQLNQGLRTTRTLAGLPSFRPISFHLLLS